MTIASSSLVAFYDTLNGIRKISTILLKIGIVLTVLALFAHWMLDLKEFWPCLFVGTVVANLIVRQSASWMKSDDHERYGKYRALTEISIASFASMILAVGLTLWLVASPIVGMIMNEEPIDLNQIKPIDPELVGTLIGLMIASLLWAASTYALTIIMVVTRRLR